MSQIMYNRISYLSGIVKRSMGTLVVEPLEVLGFEDETIFEEFSAQAGLPKPP